MFVSGLMSSDSKAAIFRGVPERAGRGDGLGVRSGVVPHQEEMQAACQPHTGGPGRGEGCVRSGDRGPGHGHHRQETATGSWVAAAGRQSIRSPGPVEVRKSMRRRCRICTTGAHRCERAFVGTGLSPGGTVPRLGSPGSDADAQPRILIHDGRVNDDVSALAVADWLTWTWSQSAAHTRSNGKEGQTCP